MKFQSDYDYRPRCGLCGKTENLVRTDCCGVWICDEGRGNADLSHSMSSCYGKHDLYTLCSYHFSHRHKGDWKNCAACRKSFEIEMYVWYGTNEFNISKLKDPPVYEPTKCIDCGGVIVLSSDHYARNADGYRCHNCSEIYSEKRFRQIMESREKEQMRKKEKEASRTASVQYFSGLTPQGGEAWNIIRSSLHDGILRSVGCGRCDDSAISLKSVTVKNDICILEGYCSQCGEKIIRLLGPED